MKSFPFDSAVTYDSLGNPKYDRAADSAILADFLHLMFADGVFPNPSTGLQVVASENEMSVVVCPGNVMIRGRMGIEEAARTLVFEASGTSYDRIDAVVARLNTNYAYRDIDLYVVKGTASATPAAPELTRTGGIYELRLANVFIAKNTTMISAERITDTRLNTEDCGIVTSNPQRVDTTAIFNQYQAALEKYLRFVRDCIDGTTAGSILARLDGVDTRLGAADISAIGDGSVTGAIAAQGTAINALNTDISKIGKLLLNKFYYDPFKSGSITIPDISSYMVFIGIVVSAQSSPMIGISTGSNLVFTGSAIIAGGDAVAARTVLNISGDTLSFVYGQPIFRIYGLF